MPKRNQQMSDDSVQYEQALGAAIGTRVRQHRQERGLTQEGGASWHGSGTRLYHADAL